MATIAQFAKEHAWLAQIFSGIMSLYNTVSQSFDSLFGKMETLAAIDLAQRRAEQAIQAKLADHRSKADWLLTMVAEQARIQSNNTVAPATIKELCKSVRSMEVARSTHEYSASLAGRILRGLELQARQLGDGSGPIFTADSEYFRCQAGTIPDHPDKKCSRNAEKHPDADLSFETIRASIDKPALEEPPTVEEQVGGVKIAVTKVQEGNENQEAYRLAHNYLYNVLGPSVTPPRGAELKTLAGKAAAAEAAGCAPAQSIELFPFAMRMAYLTRPNKCEGADKKACEAGIAMCKDANSGGSLPASFENCTKPLSAYQTEYLKITRCMRGDFYTTQAVGGRSTGDMGSDSNACYQSYQSFLQRLEAQDATMAASAGVLQAQRECWAKVQKQMGR